MKELTEENPALRHQIESLHRGGEIMSAPFSGSDKLPPGAASIKEQEESRSAQSFMQEELEHARKQIEQAHQEWEAALDAVDSPIFLHDNESRILRANRAYQRLAGLPFREIIGKRYYEIFPRMNGPLSTCQAAGRNKTACEEEITVGDRIYHSRIFPVLDEQDQFLYSAHSLEDITEQKQMVRAIAESEALNRQLFEASRDALMVVTPPSWKFTRANRAALELFGAASAAEFTTLGPWDLSPEQQADGRPSAEKAQEVIATALRAGAHFFEWTHQRLNGEPFTAEVLLSRMERKGEVFLQASVRDISEHKDAEARLAASEEKFRSLVNHIPDVIWTTDRDGNTPYISANIQRITGYTAEEFCSDPSLWFSIIHPQDRQTVAEAFGALFTQGRTFDLEYRCQRKDGEWVWVLDRAMTIYEKDGAQYADGIFTDITARKQAEHALLRSNRALHTTTAGNQALIHAEEEMGLLQEMCRAAVEVGGYRMAWVGYAQEDAEKSVRPMASVGLEEGYLESLRITWADTERGRGPTGRAIRSGQPQVARLISTDPDFAPWRAEAQKRGYASSIALPLLDGERCFGALMMYDGEPNAFDDDEIRLLREMAGDLAYGIVTLRIRQAHQFHEQRLQKNMLQTIKAIASIVEMRDPYTSGHQARVADLARAIGRHLDVAGDELQAIHLAGLVHDLGKIRIPAEILSKPGRLNEVEFSLIKMHAQAGYDILQGIDFPWPIAQMVLQHHERMDGSGYPQGLKGDNILLAARILCVADVTEAMSSHRPYRPGLGIEAALAELQRGRGTVYDEKVVAACIRLFREEGYAFSK